MFPLAISTLGAICPVKQIRRQIREEAIKALGADREGEIGTHGGDFHAPRHPKLLLTALGTNISSPAPGQDARGAEGECA